MILVNKQKSCDCSYLEFNLSCPCIKEFNIKNDNENVYMEVSTETNGTKFYIYKDLSVYIDNIPYPGKKIMLSKTIFVITGKNELYYYNTQL